MLDLIFDDYWKCIGKNKQKIVVVVYTVIFIIFLSIPMIIKKDCKTGSVIGPYKKNLRISTE